MKNIIQKEVIIVLVLIILLFIIPGGRKITDYDSSSSTKDHGTSMPMVDTSITKAVTPVPQAETLVYITRPKGGYTSYIDGSFVEPIVTPAVDPNNPDAPNPENPTEGGADAPTKSPEPFSPKNPDQVSDTGLKAVPKMEIILRSTPDSRNEDNLVFWVVPSQSLVVTDEYVETIGGDYPFWVEVLYEDRVVYAPGNKVTVG